MEEIKNSQALHTFYPADPTALSEQIDSFLQKASLPQDPPIPQMILVPHAGYVYSAQTAAYAFKAAAQRQVKTAIVLGVSHFQAISGIALWSEGSFTTPLGTTPIDASLAKEIGTISSIVQENRKPFFGEHSLEVELPFLQKVFPDIQLVPLLTGTMDIQECASFAQQLYAIVKKRSDLLIVISSDFSHYHTTQVANLMDHRALDLITSLDPIALAEKAQSQQVELCGIIGTLIALFYAKQAHLNRVEVLHKAHSGLINHDLHSVVGYAAVSFSHCAMQEAMLQVARNALEQKVLNLEISTPLPHPLLLENRGLFVTLHTKGKLRGCVGIPAERPLYQAIHEVTLLSAEDSRFQPVTKEELKDTRIQISLLSHPHTIHSIDEIVPGVHGIHISQDGHSGFYLPEVALETGWSKEELLSSLCSDKAHLPPLAWKDPQTHIEIFTTRVVKEQF